MSAPLPLQIWSEPFCKKYDSLPRNLQLAIDQKVDKMGRTLRSFPHERLQGRPEFRLRVGDYRVLYSFNVAEGRIFLLSVGHRRDIYKG